MKTEKFTFVVQQLDDGQFGASFEGTDGIAFGAFGVTEEEAVSRACRALRSRDALRKARGHTESAGVIP